MSGDTGPAAVAHRRADTGPASAVWRPRVALPWPAPDHDPERLLPYVQAIEQAGGRAVLIHPATVTSATACEALLLPGGGDIDARRYGQTPDARNFGLDPRLDELEFALTARALADGTPLLAICRGIQVLNVVAGGDLIQHIDGHRGVVHDVSAAGRLAWLDGAGVCSSHHQAVGRLAPGFAVLARATDGTIEAVECGDHRFAVGVQWHPERPPCHPGLFAALLAAAHGR